MPTNSTKAPQIPIEALNQLFNNFQHDLNFDHGLHEPAVDSLMKHYAPAFQKQDIIMRLQRDEKQEVLYRDFKQLLYAPTSYESQQLSSDDKKKLKAFFKLLDNPKESGFFRIALGRNMLFGAFGCGSLLLEEAPFCRLTQAARSMVVCYAYLSERMFVFVEA